MTNNAMLSDTTSVTSPTPFSPFSSAFSVSSEATVVSDQGEQADLGAFQSVFFALSQLQLHHSQQSTGHLPSHNSSSNEDHDHDDNPGDLTRSTTPSILPVSPFTLDPRNSQPPSRSRHHPYSSNGSSDTEGMTNGRQTADAESDVILAPAPPSSSSAAEDGDEESAALTSPNSRPSSDDISFPEEFQEEDKDEDEQGHVWTYTETAPYHSSYRSSDSADADDVSGPGDDYLAADLTDGVGLGALDSALAFIVAEREKLSREFRSIKPLDQQVLLPAIAIDAIARGRTNEKPSNGPFSAGAGELLSQESDPQDSLSVGQQSFGSPSSLDDASGSRRQPQRGVLTRSTKQSFKPTKNSLGNPPPSSSNRRRLSHRHSKSLPIDANIVKSLNGGASTTVATSSSPMPPAQERLQSFARLLTTYFPDDTSSLRRVIADPTTALGIGSHSTPSDDILVADGFFDPTSGTDGHRTAAAERDSTSPTHLHVFIDHSNILVGFLDWIRRQPVSIFKNGKRPNRPKLSHPALALIVERGRRCVRRIVVASSPLYQSINDMVRIGYQLSILQRVAVQESARDSPQGRSGTPRRPANKGKGGRGNNGRSPQNHRGSDDDSERTRRQSQQPSTPATQLSRGAKRASLQHSRTMSDITRSNSTSSIADTPSKPRQREEAVDELLQLKLLQTLLEHKEPPPGATIVLATGDANRSQFNPEGFLEPVRQAVQNGWSVEIVGWQNGRNRAYAQLASDLEKGVVPGKALGGRLKLINLDTWGLELLAN